MSSALQPGGPTSPLGAQGRLAVSYELCTMPGCPNPATAPELFRTVLRSANRDPGLVTACGITSRAGTAALPAHGSPAVTAWGQDLFPSTAGPGLSCRAYSTDRGLAGLPPIAFLAAAGGFGVGA